MTLGRPLEPFGPVAEVQEACGTEDEVIAALEGAEVLVTQMAPVTERVLDSAAERLRLVVVCRIPQSHDLLARQGSWQGAAYYTYEHSGLELEDLPIGLVGYGAVGSRVARVLCAFGARVTVHDPHVRGEIHGLRVTSLDELLSRSRAITLHARLTPETRGLLGARELALLPPGAVVVNAARGPLLDEGALCDALESGQVSAAALDTYAQEPLPPGSRLLGLADRVVLTPHLGGASRAVAEKGAAAAAAEVGRWARGEPLAHSLS